VGPICMCKYQTYPRRIGIVIGMPIMIRANSATELSIMKGQEPVVHSWDCTTDSKGKNVLILYCAVAESSN